MKKLVSQKQTRCVSSVEAAKRKEIKMISAVKKVIFTFSLLGSIAAQAISVGKVDFEKKSITGVEVELASSKSNNVSVCGAHVGGLWSLTRSNITGIQVGGLAALTEECSGIQAGGCMVLAKDISGVQIGGYGCAAGGMSGVQIGGVAPFCCNEMNGVQIGGFGSVCTNEVNGVQIGSFGSWCWNEMNGVQIGGVLNCVNEKIRGGVQITGLHSLACDMKGVQITGGWSLASVLSGLQIGAVNYIEKDFSGVQIGVFNYAGEESDNCLQIGVVNWLSANETMKIVPFVNFRF